MVTPQFLADAIVSVLRLAPGQFDVMVSMVDGPVPPLLEPQVRFKVPRLDHESVWPQEVAWSVLDDVLRRVPPHAGKRFGAELDHSALDVPWGLSLSGEPWARYGDARGVLTYQAGATRWREQNEDPGYERRMELARERFPNVDFGGVDYRRITRDR